MITNRGRFGTIYEISSKSVIKVCNTIGYEHISNEKRAYQALSLSGCCCIPRIERVGANFIIMERLDMDVAQFLSTPNSKKHVHSLISQTIDALKFVHSVGYSHGDIKTENMLLDLRNGDPVLKLSDFGLASAFSDKNTKTLPHRGTLLFISEDAHRGLVPHRRSDLENLGWVIIHSFFKCNLPWKNAKRKRQIMHEKIRMKKIITASSTFLPNQRTKLYFCHVLSLSYDDVPNYDMLVDIFS
jgi:vaccinia related kinase